jgi:hypothetical protein
MERSPARWTGARLRETQQLLLQTTEDLNAEQMATWPRPHATAIRFHLWHIARWADIVAAHLPTMGTAPGVTPAREIWAVEGLAVAWGMAGHDLGFRESGMTLSDADAQALPFPADATLRDYAARTFAAVDAAVDAIDDARFIQLGRDPLDREVTVGAAILTHLAHVARHLGMIEALRGVLGLRGTATR